VPPSSNGARVFALGPVARTISQIFRQPKSEITGIETNAQFGPLQPFKPMGGTGAQPWVSQIQPGQNLTYTPRAREQYNVTQLRDASMYDLARIIIENVEDQVSRMPINIRLKRKPGEAAKDYAKRKPDPSILKDIEQFLEQPNSEQCWSQFMRQLLDDMLVIDAATVVIRRNVKGSVYDFRAVDGAQIARYFDAWGATPQPPDPAYAQIWDAGQSGGTGFPWVDLTTDQCLYAMRNLKTYRLYGMSPLEQAITMVMTGDLRLTFQQNYYTDGTVPDAIQIVPTTISSAKLKEAQLVLNSELSGILTKRRQIRMIQGFHEDASKEQLIFPKEALLKDEFDDYVIRCLCYAFGTSPQRLQRVMGMRSGQVNQESAEKEGLEPWLDWGEKCVLGPLVRRYLGFADYEATYQEDTTVDPKEQSEIDASDVKVGIRTLNEIREERGLPPLAETEADQSLIITATGPVPLSLDDQVEHAKKMFEAKPPQPQNGNGNGPQKLHKRRRAAIDPGHDTPARRHARGRLEAALVKLFGHQREKAGEEARRLIKKVRKADDPEEIADKIFASIEGEFSQLPAEARAALEQAALSGVSDAWAQIEVTDSGVISQANIEAAEYATKRAAELVGMKYNQAGELVENPNAEYAISSTTRDRLREIIKNAFENKTPFSEIISDIESADIFSEDRAAMIARTEVSRAQVNANLSAWKKTGLVSKVRWLAVGPDPCPICESNDDEIRPIGARFPSGDVMPLAHPNCYCILEAVLPEEK
jgi:portal protein